MTLRRLCSLALLALGCSQLGVRGTLSPEGFHESGELMALRGAVDEWDAAVPAAGLSLVPSGGDWVVERYDYSGEPKFGHTSRWRARIRIDADKLRAYFPRGPLEHLKSTAMHEIGHALGMKGHAKEGLMSAPHAGFTCVDAVTLAWLLRERPELRPGAKVTCI